MSFILSFILFFFSQGYAKDMDAKVNSELGYRYSARSSQSEQRPYLQTQLQKKFGEEYSAPMLDVGFRASQEHSETNTEAELRSFLLTQRGSHHIIEWGLQNVSWSETFGFNILDLVNPRDWREFVFEDLSWAQLPVWALKTTFVFGGLKIQPLYVPRARNPLLPEKGSFFDPLPTALQAYTREDPSKKEFFKSAEGGVRLEYLFDFGLDLSVISYSHYNREPSYFLEGTKLVLADERLQSYAMSFTYSDGGFVLRGDTLKTLKAPYFSERLESVQKDHLQGIYGVDYTFSNQLILGLQYQFSDIKNDQWGAFQLKKTLGDFDFQCLYFKGINNGDSWWRPEILWRLPHSLSLRLYGDFIEGKEAQGYFGVYRRKQQFVSTASWLF